MPELFASGYNFINTEEVSSLAEPLEGGETCNALLHFANSNNCYIVYGFAENESGKYYNSAAIVGPNNFKGLYRKVHLFDREKLFFQPGNLGFNVFETTVGRIGIMVCFDWYFPEGARTLTVKGAQLIAHPANLVLPYCPDSMPVRCRENRVFAATANRIGVEDRGGHSLTFIGQSQVTDIRGNILVRCATDQTAIACLELDLRQADDKKLNSYNDLMEDRFPQYYL